MTEQKNKAKQQKNLQLTGKIKATKKGESQKFWIDLLHDVFGVENATQFISFEDQVHLDHTSFIDGYISATKVMIEQKSLRKDLRKAIKQSDGTLLKSVSAGKTLFTELPYDQQTTMDNYL